jgi:hypothetical protein
VSVDFSRSGLEAIGFTGFVPLAELRAARPRTWAIPADEGGVYIAYRDSTRPPRFRRLNPATWRGDRTLPLAELRGRWVEGSSVVYIGKADLTVADNSLRKRVRAYLRFGAGHNAAHAGGYSTWQLANSERLLIAWRVVRPPRTPLREEQRLCKAHQAAYGRVPFANA